MTVQALTGSKSVPANFQKQLGERRALRSQTNTLRDALSPLKILITSAHRA